MVLIQAKKKISASLEDYLEAIYLIIEEKQAVKAVEVARFLNVGRSSVTEALKNLATKGLINHGRYEEITFTKLGEDLAKDVIKKHKILYRFFYEILGLDSEEASENACRVEHVISNNALDKLISYVEKIEK